LAAKAHGNPGSGQTGGEAMAQTFAALRPKLHRYCARMVGSAIDAEDVVQDALAKAIAALQAEPAIAHVEGWLFRIAHNAALDFLRQRARQQSVFANEDIAMVPDLVDPVQQRELAAAGLRNFMRLSASERSAVILMDVLGYSLDEISRITESTIPAIKAALHRGRTRLRTIMQEPADSTPPALHPSERTRLMAYIDRFNARDFDAVRSMLAEDVQLDLVGKTRMRGAEVGRYFGNYASISDWQLRPGLVEGRPAAIVMNPADLAAPPRYFILLDWTEEHVSGIRDFRHVHYVAEGAEIILLDPSN